MTSNGWLPVRAYWQKEQACLDWCLFGETAFTESFFDQTVQRLLQHPFHHLFRQQTGFEVLGDLPLGGLAPTGFIFHVSRCGSTLLGRLLSGFPENIVLSEPPPLDFVLRARRIDWLQGLVKAYGQKRTERAERLFIKFDAWHIHDLPLIRETFPEVPWIFLYRNPIEVLASHAKQAGSWMVPSIVPPHVLHVEREDWIPGQQQEYWAKVLSKIYQAGLDHCRQHGGLLVNYEELPGALWGRLANPFRLSADEETVSRIKDLARFDAKTPGMSFEQDQQRKQASATERMRELAAQYLDPIYHELEAARLKQLPIS